MNRSKSRIDIIPMEEGSSLGYIAWGHHDSRAFIQAVREQEALPEYLLPDDDPFVEQGYLDRNSRVCEASKPGARPATFRFEAAAP